MVHFFQPRFEALHKAGLKFIALVNEGDILSLASFLSKNPGHFFDPGFFCRVLHKLPCYTKIHPALRSLERIASSVEFLALIKSWLDKIELGFFICFGWLFLSFFNSAGSDPNRPCSQLNEGRKIFDRGNEAL